MTFYSVVFHDGLGRVSKHLSHIEVEGLHTITLLKREVSIASGLTDNIQRSTFAFCNLTDMLDMFFVDKQAHTFLTLVGDDFLGAQRLVANWQLGHVNLTTTLFNKLRQTV